ncbi:MAG: amidohydrolase family protein [Candidatus Bathyarchaeia archaeon]
MKIDIEAHFYTKEYIKTLRRNEGYPKFIWDEETKTYWLWYTAEVSRSHRDIFLEKILDVGELRVREMDEAGVIKQVLSLSTPGVEQLETSVAVRLARETNDFLSKVVEKYPERFDGFAALAPQDPGEAADELERAVKDLGLKGWKTHSNFGNTYIDNKRYWPILEKAEKLGVPIYLHPTVPAIPQLREYGFPLAAAAFGFGVETAMCVMRLIFSGALDKYPRLKIILGHLGEGLPFIFRRIDYPFLKPTLSNEEKPKIAKKPSEYIRNNIYVTTSGNYHEPAFLCTYWTLGIDRILFATDYPYEDLKECIMFIEKIPITLEEKEKIYYKNAASLIPRLI